MLVFFVFSCATPVELKDQEMETLLEQIAAEYEDLDEYLAQSAIHEEELDPEILREFEQRTLLLYEELPELPVSLNNFRSRFADQQALALNPMPEVYRLEPGENRELLSDRGFRVQIISTRDARLADEIRDDFEEWIRSVSAPPHPRTYLLFQQPFYRVQVGDFLQREHASDFTELARLRYPDAWVVHSRIHPGRTHR